MPEVKKPKLADLVSAAKTTAFPKPAPTPAEETPAAADAGPALEESPAPPPAGKVIGYTVELRDNPKTFIPADAARDRMEAQDVYMRMYGILGTVNPFLIQYVYEHADHVGAPEDRAGAARGRAGDGDPQPEADVQH